VTSFSNGMAVVERDGSYGIVDEAISKLGSQKGLEVKIYY